MEITAPCYLCQESYKIISTTFISQIIPQNINLSKHLNHGGWNYKHDFIRVSKKIFKTLDYTGGDSTSLSHIFNKLKLKAAGLFKYV